MRIEDEIKELIKNRYKSIAAFCRVVNLPETTIGSMLTRGFANSKTQNVIMVCNELNIDIEALYDGKIKEKINKKPEPINIPVLNKISAGHLMYAEQDIIDYVQITKEMAKKGEYFALEINGDSMYPELKNGDIALFIKQSICENGNICAVIVNGDEATVKKVSVNKNGLTLIPINPDYEVMSFSDEEIKQFPITIAGKLVKTLRNF